MRRLLGLVALALVTAPAPSLAQDGKEPGTRPLADEAAYLAEKGGKSGWESEEVTLTRGGEKAKGRLAIAFAARKGTPGGLVTLRWQSGGMNGAVGDVGFELVERGGRRLIQVKDAAGKEVALALEYTVTGDVLTIKGAVSKAWTGLFDDDPTKAVTFRPGK